jgi:2'-5' RNA ligase
MSLRAFISLELPQTARQALEGVQRELAPAGRNVKWVRPEGIHLTLKFLGNIEEAQVEPLYQAMSQASSGCGPLRLRMKGVGAFPGLSRPRVVWVGLTGDTERLIALAQDLERRLTPLGFAPEGRPFTPHLTLGRVKEFGAGGKGRGPAGAKSPLSEAVLKLSGLELEGFEVGELVLFRSELKPGGAVYTRLRSVRLQEVQG